MSNYVESNLNRGETIVKQAKMSPISLVVSWIGGVVFFWLLFIPTIKAVINTISFFMTELTITNKRVVGKVGIINTKSMDASLNKIQNVSASNGLFGKIFNYGTVHISTASGDFIFKNISSPDEFKGTLMSQIDIFEEERIQTQATQMANAIHSANSNS